jgi:hypothetical protein
MKQSVGEERRSLKFHECRILEARGKASHRLDADHSQGREELGVWKNPEA